MGVRTSPDSPSAPTLSPVRHAGLVRIYVPLTVSGLATLHKQGRIGVESGIAHAVTPALRAAWEQADDEELEYAALMAAAFGSLMSIKESGASPRRVVAAVDIDDSHVVVVGTNEAEATAVVVDTPILISWCKAVHVDSADAEGEVSIAVSRLAEAIAGNRDALAQVALVEHELMWFATQEIPDLLQ